MSRRNPRQAKLGRKSKKAAKNQRHKKGRQHRTASSLTLLSGLNEAERLLNKGATEDAVEVLEELARRNPRRWDVLHLLREAHLRQGDMWSYQAICQRLIDLDSEDADSWYALGAAALENGQLALAHHAFSHFLSRWPDHRHADDSTHTIRSELADFLQTQTASLKVPEAEALELLVLHEKINLHLHLGKDERVISLAGRLLVRCPTFAPTLNNRSLSHFRSGNHELAIADARRVLEFDPGNFHALGNLARFLFLSGEFEEARTVVERLKTVESDSPDRFAKQAEAFSYLGDWTAVLEVLRRAENSHAGVKGANMGMLYHAAGVAAAELGQLDTARKHWRRAVKVHSVAEWAQDNLSDLKQSPGQQNGPWAFPMNYWIPEPVIDRLRVEMERAGPRAKEAEVCRRLRKFFEQHPYLEKLMPVLLERGDLMAKEFVVRVASLSENAAILLALKDFSLGRRGTDELRRAAAVRLVEAKSLEPSRLKMWVKGEQQEVSLMSFEIMSEPTNPVPKDVEPLALKAQQALHEGDGAAAEPLLDKALERHPDDPSLAYNRSVAIQLQGREEEAMAIVRDIHSRHPDYLFARVRLSEEAVKRRDFAQARKLLEPLVQRSRFHLSEYTALCHANIELLSAEGETEGARMWLKMWQDIALDDERLIVWSARLSKHGWLRKIFQKQTIENQ